MKLKFFYRKKNQLKKLYLKKKQKLGHLNKKKLLEKLKKNLQLREYFLNLRKIDDYLQCNLKKNLFFLERVNLKSQKLDKCNKKSSYLFFK